MMQKLSAIFLLLCFLIYVGCTLGASVAFAETADGYVTNLYSPTAFEVGAVRVALDAHTACREQRTLPLFVNTPGFGTTLPPSASAWQHRGFGGIAATPAPCSKLELAVGTHVRLEGDRGSTEYFRAAELTTYKAGSLRKVNGAALLQEAPHLVDGPQGWHGTLWVNGYAIAITPNTRLLSAPAGTRLGYRMSFGSQTMVFHPKLPVGRSPIPFTSSLLAANTWVSYHAVRAADGTVTASRVRFWTNQVDAGEKGYLERFHAEVFPPDYSKHLAGSIRFAQTIEIIPDQATQNSVSELGRDLVPQYQKDLPSADPTKIDFRFYVVRPFIAQPKTMLVDTDGLLPTYKRGPLGLGLRVIHGFNSPTANTTVEDVVALPNGLILIPDTALARLRDKAQLAALLSCAISSVLQKQAYMALPITVSRFTTLGRPLGNPDFAPAIQVFAIWQNEQVLRLGIRSMQQAGYDIREAPFAWSVARGEPLNNPVVASSASELKKGKQAVPWYASYAMNILSRDYAAADYSKLKTGEAEYAKLRDELYKAAPDLRRLPASKKQSGSKAGAS